MIRTDKTTCSVEVLLIELGKRSVGLNYLIVELKIYNEVRSLGMSSFIL